MLAEALAVWERLSPGERLLTENPEDTVFGEERFYPEGGLVLRVLSRDLPRDTEAADWHAFAWNQDNAWFTRDEARRFLPERPAAGMRHEVPTPLVQRLARFHLVDNVRGQTTAFGEREVERAALHTEVVSVEGSGVDLRLEGETRAAARGTWSIRGFQDMDAPTPQARGVVTRISGSAKFDLELGRFLEFDAAATGERWGGTQYNCRGDDLAPAPIGFALTLAGRSPADRVAPAFFRLYGWR